jgi:Family of unknown function (DUF5522)
VTGTTGAVGGGPSDAGAPPPWAGDPGFEPDPDEPDWIVEPDGRWVATRSGLLRQGACCGNGCRSCPWVGTPWVNPNRPDMTP